MRRGGSACVQDARKGVLFDSFPPVLQLQLKRFEYDFQRDIMVKVGHCDTPGHAPVLLEILLVMAARHADTEHSCVLPMCTLGENPNSMNRRVTYVFGN